MCYGGAVASLFKPWYGLLIYVCFAIIKPQFLWYWSVPPGNYARIVALALLAGWTLNGFGKLNFGAAKPIVLCLVGFLAWMTLSALQTINSAVAFTAVEEMVKIVLPFVVGVTLIDSVAQLKQLAWTIMLSQGFVAYEMNLAYYSGFNRIQEVGFAQMDNNCVAIAMVAGAGLAFMMGLGERVWWRKLLCFLAAALMAHCVMFAFSRGGMLGLIITGMVSFFIIPKKPKHYLMFGLAAALALRLAGPEVLERFGKTFADKEKRDESAQSRVVMWGMCLQLMAESPLLGVGPDQFPVVMERFGIYRGKEAHTLWLQTGAELGVPGLGFLVAYYGLCSWRLWRGRRQIALMDPRLADAARMVIASTAGFAVSAQFVSLEGLELPYYVTMIGAGALKLAGQPRSASAPALAQPRSGQIVRRGFAHGTRFN
jgi:putative inorganic carbon (hco3(-)) transporter